MKSGTGVLWSRCIEVRELPGTHVRAGPAREVDWPCPAQFYVLGCDFWTRCWSCTNPQTESRPFEFLFLSERYGRNNDPKKYKSDHNLSLKRKKENCTSGPNTRLNFQIENRKIERGIAEMPFSPFSAENTWLICIWNRFLVVSLDSWRIGPWNYSPCVFSIVSTKFHLDRKRWFIYEFSVDKLVFLSFRGYLGEIESGEKNERKKNSDFFTLFSFDCAVVCQGQCFQFSSPNSLKRWR